MPKKSISNSTAAIAVLRAASAVVALLDAGYDVNSPRVRAYCERVSARTGRPVQDLLDLSLRELEGLERAVRRLKTETGDFAQPGGVIPGCADSNREAQMLFQRGIAPHEFDA